jgi:hypothetical protein
VQAEDDAMRALFQLARANNVLSTAAYVAFTFCLLIVAIFDNQFEVTLANEPGGTFH